MRFVQDLRAKVRMLNRAEQQGYVVTGKGELEHRVVCRTAWGLFPRSWVVHHIDHNKRNNDPENLIALPRDLHDKLHSIMWEEGKRLGRSIIEGYLRPYKDPNGGYRVIKKPVPRWLVAHIAKIIVKELNPRIRQQGPQSRSGSSAYR